MTAGPGAAPPWLPPLLRERPLALRIVLAGVIPLAFGVLTGFALDRSVGGYFILLVLASLGGVGAGLDHDSALLGARRGVLGGALFTAGILGTNEAIGATHADELPDPHVLLFVLNCAAGAAFGALGGRLRARAAVNRG
jgi:hypothetical protein